jgi:hypothetical protein
MYRLGRALEPLEGLTCHDEGQVGGMDGIGALSYPMPKSYPKGAKRCPKNGRAG